MTIAVDVSYCCCCGSRRASLFQHKSSNTAAAAAAAAADDRHISFGSFALLIQTYSTSISVTALQPIVGHCSNLPRPSGTQAIQSIPVRGALV